ncbi:MAG: PQQ-like beta-propeller repeat protein [Rickettsiales bacterium]|jgi:outer membrane protein assembly factor BamB|nr:PQQ-like beta-propeller repeat protein [Rickettsiales bacterium]
MRRLEIFALILIAVLGACSKQDPILPGARESIFDEQAPVAAGAMIANLPETAFAPKNAECSYIQDSSNSIFRDGKKIFGGFPTSNSVKSEQKPVCDGGFVYAGLTTGELVKINPKTREIAWIADIFKTSSMTGGSSALDITAPIVIKDKNVYVGGLGDIFCKLNKSSGAKIWCANIGTGEPFVIAGAAVFIIGTNNLLYAVDDKDGGIYWNAKLKKQAAPEYENKIITVGKEKFDATNGESLK